MVPHGITKTYCVEAQRAKQSRHSELPFHDRPTDRSFVLLGAGSPGPHHKLEDHLITSESNEPQNSFTPPSVK